MTLKVRILHILMTYTQVTARLENFVAGWLLVLGLKEGQVECATVCVKSEVILYNYDVCCFKNRSLPSGKMFSVLYSFCQKQICNVLCNKKSFPNYFKLPFEKHFSLVIIIIFRWLNLEYCELKRNSHNTKLNVNIFWKTTFLSF